MSKVVLYIATSLDGFIARQDGDISWLDEFNSDQEDYGYQEFYKGVGALVMGSRTYEQALGFGQWPHPGVKSYVVTSKHRDLGLDGDVEFYSGDLTELVQGIKGRTDKDIWLVGGAALVSSFMNENLIDDVIISVIPVLLAGGIPLFQDIHNFRRLKLMSAKTYEPGVVQLQYCFS